jgi:hypothetical protein
LITRANSSVERSVLARAANAIRKNVLSALKREVSYVAARYGLSIVRQKRYAELIATAGLVDVLRRLDGLEADEIEFSEFCLQHGVGAHAQYQQDMFALWHTGLKRGGVFVEFGAADGILHSNTFVLEDRFNWSGVLIEPHPDFFRLAKANRPRSTVINGVADPTYGAGGSVDFVLADQLSSIRGYHVRDKHSESRKDLRSVRVACLNLTSTLLRQIPSRTIDFMSIDTEGSELEIVTGFDFSQLDVSCLCVEVNDRAKDAEAIVQHLASAGFEQAFSRRVTRDDLWFRKRSSGLAGR